MRDDRAAAARRLADAEQCVPRRPGRAHRRRAGVPAAVERESDARSTSPRRRRGPRGIDGVDRRARPRRGRSSLRVVAELEARRARARSRPRRRSARRRSAAARSRTSADGSARRPPGAAPRWRRSGARITSSERERERLERGPHDRRARGSRRSTSRTRSASRPTSSAWTGRPRRSPTGERSSSTSGATLTEKIEELEDVAPPASGADATCSRRGGATSRRPPARGSSGSHAGHAIGLLARSGEHRARPRAGARRGARAARRRRRLRRRRPCASPTPRRATAPSSRSRRADRCRSASAASAQLLSVVEAEPAARGIASTVLRDVYLACTVDEAVAKQAAHPAASFVTPEGVLDRPGGHPHREGSRRARPRDPRRAAGAGRTTSPRRATRLADPSAAGRDRRRGHVPAGADGRRRCRYHRRRRAALRRWRAELAGQRKEAEMLRQRVVVAGRRDGALACASRRQRARLPRRCPSCLALPAAADLARAWRSRHSVATASTLDARLVELRAERDALAAHDPVQLRAEPRGRRRPTRAEQTIADGRRRRARGVRRARDAAAEAERARRRGRGGGQHARGARPPPSSTGSARRTRTRTACAATSSGASREAERLIREGYRREPDDALATLDRGRLRRVAREEVRAGAAPAGAARPRQPARDRRARGAAGAARLHGSASSTTSARPAATCSRSSRRSTGDHRDVRPGVPRRGDAVRAADRGAVPGGAGRLVLTDPAQPAHQRHRDRGEPRPQAREAHLAAVRRRALAHRDGVPVRDLHGPAVARST